MTRLQQYGWRGEDDGAIARVVSAHGDYYRIVCNGCEGEIIARKKKSAFGYRRYVEQASGSRLKTGRDDGNAGVPVPITGDFVRFRRNDAGESFITEVLPRYSQFFRKDANARRKAQLLAVNFDVLMVMMSLNEDFSVPRIARYLELASEMGKARAVVAVSKCDLREPGDGELLDELRAAVGERAQVIEFSALTGEGMEQIVPLFAPGQTVALVGSSGVGKSTLINTLSGAEVTAVKPVQDWSGRGRHTTTVRQLWRLPGGALVIDTPGIREIGLLGETERIVAKGAASHRYRVGEDD